MKTNIDKIYTSKTASELVVLANQFERIAKAEKDEWLPSYYAAYCFVRSTVVAEMEIDFIHEHLDKAQNIIDELQKVNAQESEVFALQAMIYQLRITDMSKGYKYSRMAAEAIGQAERLNPGNPRVFYLRGSNTFHTPKMFGGGPEKAKADLSKAAEMFQNQQTENPLAPGWGAAHNKQLLSKCSQE